MLLAAFLLAQAHPQGAPAAVPAEAARVEYTLREVPGDGGAPPSWRVYVHVRDLPASGELHFDLDDWGEWDGLEPPYAVSHLDGAWTARLEPEHGGRFTFVYSIQLTALGSERHRAHGLLAADAGEYRWGYTNNVLVHVLLDGEELEGVHQVILLARDEGPIVTGWGGEARGMQRASFEAWPGNGPIAFGAPRHTSTLEENDFRVEVFQFGHEQDVTQPCGEVVLRAAQFLGEATGVPARNPSRLFLTHSRGGGMGSDHGLRVGFAASGEPEDVSSLHYRRLIVHELFHDWLGSRLTDGGDHLVWFKEGFTDYFALWTAAATGIVTREEFVSYLQLLESFARQRSALGKVAFGEPDVNWRDGDGPIEMLAYQGGAVLAFVLDAELRLAGHSGLLQLVRDLFEPGTGMGSYRLDDLREWLVDHGLERRYAQSIAGTILPATDDYLPALGFEVDRRPTPLTYVGLRTDRHHFPITILAVDPEGPAGKAGVRPGDKVTGFWPARAVRPRYDPPDHEYLFGLDVFEPGYEGTYLGVHRADGDHQIFFDPVVLDGGYFPSYSAKSKRLDAFFRFVPH